MATRPPKRQVPKPERSVIDWLLDSDPSIRWQVMRDLTGAPAETVAVERARVTREGWGARLLARQETSGHWGGDPENPEWTCFLALMWLRDLGLEPTSTEARRAVGRVRDNVTWHWWDNRPFFEGEVEPCINGRVVAVGAYFGQEVQSAGLVDRLRGLEYMRRAGVTPDGRIAEAIDLVVRKRGQDGRWSLENPHPDQMDLGMDEAEGKPSRWNTLRALRVLDWYSAQD